MPTRAQYRTVARQPMTERDALRREFVERFGAAPRGFRAPGRVNLIGEHTDYNAGFVMPVAIQFDTIAAVAPRLGRTLRVRSTNFAQTCEVDLARDAAATAPRGAPVPWFVYVLAIVRVLREHGVALTGADLLIHGNVPLGAGLSSSAALDVAVALALSSAAGERLEPLTLTKLCQRAENDYVGTRCGIMDPFASVFGHAGHALQIDCRSLEYEYLPLHPGSAQTGAQIVICNTMVRHQHAGGEYNRRREECEHAVTVLRQWLPGLESLRDLAPQVLQQHERALDPVILRRCRHIVTENERVLAAAAALKAADLAAFGALMNASHRSLREDFEISCTELDLMVQIAGTIDGVYGARMTGGGFGGCTVNLVRTDAVPQFRAQIVERYRRATGIAPDIYVCTAADGAGAIEL